MQHTEPPAVERSLALYLALLRAYPPAFRERYGAEMALAFRDAARDALSQSGFLGLIALWVRTVGDTVVSATHERLYGWDESVGVSRRRAFVKKALSLLAVFVAVIAVGWLTWEIPDRWLPRVRLENRGWAAVAEATALGLLYSLADRRPSQPIRSYRCIQWVGLTGWFLWLVASKTLGVIGTWAQFMPMVALLSALWITDEDRLLEKRTQLGTWKRHIPIAAPALMLLLASPPPYLATNMFLLHVIAVNGVSAGLYYTETRAQD